MKPVPASFFNEIVDCRILVPSGVDVFLLRKRKKTQSLSLSGLVFQEMQRNVIPEDPCR